MSQLHNDNVLVLNRYFLAVQIISAKRAISALYTGKAKAVDRNFTSYSFEEWVDISKSLKPEDYSGLVRSPSVSLYVPQVVQEPTNEFAASIFRSPRFSRKNIFQRDKYICQYCGQKKDKNDLTRDHIIPKSKGGPDTWENLVACCLECNNYKGDRTLAELGWKLRTVPTKPNWQAHINKSVNDVKKAYWSVFLHI